MSTLLRDERIRTAGFERHEYLVHGVRTVLYSAGQGRPVVYFHGAGIFQGFEFARAWTDHCRVILPYHPGFGESADDDQIGSLHDYVNHYLELFDQLGLDQFDLVGCSMGGRLAAEFAVAHAERIRKLVLVCPAGLAVPDHPMTSLAAIPPAELISYLIEDASVLTPFLPDGPDPAFAAMRAREGTAVGRVLRNGSLVNPKLGAWLHRVQVPTLLLWGEGDRLIPVGQAEAWARLLPQVQVQTWPRAGHLLLDELAAAREAVVRFLSDVGSA
ncbi:alpha/beta fold hydrolase [Duganella radicis]|uniref:Alpha/beta fold hydrolase n=1 Tax=Duganella radicis TaxID=551988 RepID=A0A6L6PQ98_9BURK|nr:alpha/beta hydrolase [Duganella radicis]MTV41082.1 alpha/beta fold hydrolase [Duganella radicis]